MSTTKNYAWKIPSFAKNIDIDLAIQEMERIESLYGSLTPQNILDASRPQNALFHTLFQWDDTIAAEHYRLQQARTILNNIEVTVISNGQPKQISVYEVVKDTLTTPVYKSINTMTTTDITFIKQRTLKELTILKDKLSVYKEFGNVMSGLNQAIQALNTIP
jgi:hypothetical protein